MKLENVIERGEVLNWDYMDTLFSHIFETYSSLTPADTPLVLLNQPSVFHKERQLYAESLFELHQTNQILFATTSLCTLLGVGAYSGLLLDSGESLTTCLGYLNGSPIEKTLFKIDIGGRDITKELCKLLRLYGYIFDTSVFL